MRQAAPDLGAGSAWPLHLTIRGFLMSPQPKQRRLLHLFTSSFSPSLDREFIRKIETSQAFAVGSPSRTQNTEFDTRSNLCPNPGDAGGRP
jgi:hypothetical protein